MPIPPVSPQEEAIDTLIVDELIYKTLLGDATINSYIGNRIFEYQHPSGADYPCIVFNNQTPPRDIRGVGSATIMTDTLYVIKVIGETTSYLPIQPISKKIHSLFNGMQATNTGLDQNGTVIGMVREEVIKYPEVDAGKHYRHLGGLYRVFTSL